MSEIIDKLLILLFKLLESGRRFLRVAGIVIQSIKLIDSLLNGILQVNEHIVDFLVYKSKVAFCAFKIGDLI